MLIFIPVLSAAAWLLIEVMAVLNLSGTLALSAPGVSGWSSFVLSSAAAFILPYITTKQTNKLKFFIWFVIQLGVMILLSTIFGRYYHRDFHSYGTQIILLSFLLFILKLDDISIVRHRTALYKVLTLAVIAMFMLWAVWLMMMGYAIVTRAEPRWIESTGYNLINVLIGLTMLVVAGYVWNRTRKRLHFKGELLHLDERDISKMLSPQECSIINAFLSAPDNALTCKELYNELKDLDSEPACTKCMNENWTATGCPSYRNYKNRINDIKKYLELLQIGTVVPVSENPREIKEKGWRLRLFDDIHYQPM